jgi:hypothetical protein
MGVRLQVTWCIVFSFLVVHCSCNANSTDDSRNKGNGTEPAQLSRGELFDIKMRCAEIGRRFHAELARDLDPKQLPMAPRFAYNAEMNTCLYNCGILGRDLPTHHFIIDLATEETLAEFFATPENTLSSPGGQAFKNQERELFGEYPVQK